MSGDEYGDLTADEDFLAEDDPTDRTGKILRRTPIRHGGTARILNPDEDPSTPDGAYAADEPRPWSAA